MYMYIYIYIYIYFIYLFIFTLFIWLVNVLGFSHILEDNITKIENIMATRSIALKNQDTVIAMNAFIIYLCNKKNPKFILDEKKSFIFLKSPPI